MLRAIHGFLLCLSLGMLGGVGCSTTAPDPCRDIQCQQGESCEAGLCVSSCEAGQLWCEGKCLDTSHNIKHCGQCGNMCRAGELCREGRCVLECPSGEGVCDGRCVDTSTEPKHCGSCGRVCQPGEVCSKGNCTLYCQEGMTNCSGRCVDVKTSTKHCGQCGTVCGGGKPCVEGECKIVCPSGQDVCGGRCVDLQRDTAHCGQCANICGQGYTCKKGQCVRECSVEQTVCGGECVNLRIDERHCGACGNACLAGQSCVSKRCEYTCPAGQTACGKVCVDTNTNVEHCGKCGNTCQGGELCKEGSCRCPQGYFGCNGVCKDVQRDPSNCGGCGQQCGKDAPFCVAKKCVYACPATQADCNGRCANLNNDVFNCGKCGVSCSGGQVCANGQCICPTSYTFCGGQCVDLAKERSHCGACGNVCTGELDCYGGWCGCTGGKTACQNTCKSLQTDAEHCGKCDHKCAKGEVCVAGVCQCPQGEVSCGGTCRDIQNDDAHCGGCYKVCGGNEICRKGSCTACPSGKTKCGEQCVDLTSDPQHCGVCGRRCLTTVGSVSKNVALIDSPWLLHWMKGGVDRGGNVYVANRFYEEVTIGGVTFSAPKGKSHIFIAKYAPTGKWSWAKQIAGDYITVDHLKVDRNGHVLLQGRIQGDVTFGQRRIRTHGGTPSNPVKWPFVAKLDGTGKWLWVQVIETTGSTSLGRFSVDILGNVYVAGTFTNTTVKIGSKTLSSTATAMYIAKLDAAGQLLWVKELKGGAKDYLFGVFADRAGALFVVGYFSQQLVLGRFSFSFSGGGPYARGMFVAKLSRSGTWLWANYAAPSSSSPSNGAGCSDMVVDATGSVFLMGSFDGETFFGQTGIGYGYARGGHVAKLDSAGKWVWVKEIFSTSSGLNFYSLLLDARGDLLLVGTFTQDLILDGVPIYGSNQPTGFIATLKRSGVWGTASKEGVDLFGTFKNAAGQTYMLGAFRGKGTFRGMTLSSSSKNSAFVVEYADTAQVCLAGVCCASGMVQCGGGCVSLPSDPLHCGACGKACGVGMLCVSGRCVCPTGETNCNGTCVYLPEAHQHCGTCGKACANDESCSAGVCTKWPQGQSVCLNQCVDLTSDTQHCGVCGRACVGGQVCVGGGCACPALSLWCSGLCVDPQTDEQHCGACGNVCASGQTCTSGSCQ